ncbi:MAG: glucosaminidase domain-containing protein [Chloroflexota bacterium]
MTSIRRPRFTLAVLAAALVMTVAVPTADARMPRARKYHVGGAITLDTNLLSASGASAWAIDEYLKAKTSLPALGIAFVAAEKKYGVNARFLLAAAMHESASGTSYISRKKHNLFGYNAYDRSPFRYASAFASYAAGIDATARFIKESYLTPGGRWWGGRPTLRSMQQFWSSSHRWGEGVSRIATRIHLHTLARRSIRFAAPAVDGPLAGQTQTTVRLTWTGGAIPAVIGFAATWRTVALDSEAVAGTIEPPAPSGPGILDVVALRAGSATPSPQASVAIVPRPPRATSVAARRVRTDAHTITIAVPAPREPGRYGLDIEMLDSGGRPLPAAQAIDIPNVEVRVWSHRAVTYQLEPSVDGTGVVVRVTNTGLVTIPAGTDRNSSASRDPDAKSVRSMLTVTASTNDRTNPSPVRLLEKSLVTALLPGASVTFDVPGIAAATHRTTNSLSVNLGVLGDPTWLEVQSPAGAWSWGAERDGPVQARIAAGDAPAP